MHRGIIPIGIPFLKATADQLSTLRQKSMTHCDVVDFPVQGSVGIERPARQLGYDCSGKPCSTLGSRWSKQYSLAHVADWADHTA